MKAAPIFSNFQGPNVPRFTRFVPWTAAAAPTQPRPASRRPSRRCWSWTQRGRGAPQRCRAGSLKRPLGRPLDFSRWGKDFSWIFWGFLGIFFWKKWWNHYGKVIFFGGTVLEVEMFDGSWWLIFLAFLGGFWWMLRWKLKHMLAHFNDLWSVPETISFPETSLKGFI